MAEEAIDKEIILLPGSSFSMNDEEEVNGSNSSSLPSSVMVDYVSENDTSPFVVCDKQTQKDTSSFIVPPSPTYNEVEKAVVLASLTPDRFKTERTKARRNSTDIREKPIPHYIRASTGSCHDYCKYGRLHTFAKEEKRRPIRRTIMINTEPSEIIGVDVKTMNTRERRKKSLIKVKATKSEVISESLSEKLKTVLTEKVVSHLQNPESIENSQISSKLKTSGMKDSLYASTSGSVNSGRNSSSDGSPNLINPRRTSYESSENSTRGARSKKIHPSYSLQAVNDKRKSGTNLAKSPDFSNGLISPSGGSSCGRSSGISSLKGSGDLRNLKPSNRKSNEGKLSNNSQSSNDCRNGMLIKKTGLPTPGVKKLSKPPLASMSPHLSSDGSGRIKPLKIGKMKASSPGNKQKSAPKSQSKDDMVSIKTIHMIEAKPKKGKIQSSQSSMTSQDEEEHVDTESMLSEADGLESEEAVTKAKSINGITKDEAKSRTRRSTSIRTEDGGEVPRKLSFRRGKVVNLQSGNGGPRKLRFRQGRIVGENQVKVDVGRKSFRRKKELGGAASDKANSLGETVVLRHQDVQGKKDEQILFNDVIEETANKLVETRKSKVKALVGAFETVISLQESKPVIAT